MNEELDEALSASAHSARILTDLSGRFPEKYTKAWYDAMHTASQILEAQGQTELAEEMRSALPMFVAKQPATDKSPEGDMSSRQRDRQRGTAGARRKLRRSPESATTNIGRPGYGQSLPKTMLLDTTSPESPFYSGKSQDPALWHKIATNTDADGAFRFSGDSALGKYDWAIEKDVFSDGLRVGDGDLSLSYPIAMIEFRQGLMAVDRRDGGAYEAQVQVVCDLGFKRLGQGACVVPKINGWRLGREERLTCLRDEERGLWASVDLHPDEDWRAAARRYGAVLVLYGVELGVALPVDTAEADYDWRRRSEELRRSRALGLVAAGLVEWEPE